MQQQLIYTFLSLSILFVLIGLSEEKETISRMMANNAEATAAMAIVLTLHSFNVIVYLEDLETQIGKWQWYIHVILHTIYILLGYIILLVDIIDYEEQHIILTGFTFCATGLTFIVYGNSRYNSILLVEAIVYWSMLIAFGITFNAYVEYIVLSLLLVSKTFRVWIFNSTQHAHRNLLRSNPTCFCFV